MTPTGLSWLLAVVYFVGSFTSQPYGKDWNWAQAWRASLWPFVIVANEVPPLIQKYAKKETGGSLP